VGNKPSKYRDDLFAKLESSSTLRQLEISYIDLDEISIKNPSLEKLTVAKAYKLWLPENPKVLERLEKLDLGYNVGLDEKNRNNLRNLIASSKSLQIINTFYDVMLCASMSRSLGRLNLRLEDMDDECTDVFVQLIRRTKSIYHLRFDTDCESMEVQSILAALCDNQSLTYFCLETYFESMIPAADLLAVLHKNRHLMELDLENSVIDHFYGTKVDEYIDPEDPHASALREAVAASQRLIRISGIFEPEGPEVKRMRDGVERAKIEAKWILLFCRIMAGSRFKDGRAALPVEILLLITKRVTVGGFWIAERLNLIVRCASNRNTVGKLYSEYLEFSVGSLEYLCKQSAL
jgi:hypothetical protein